MKNLAYILLIFFILSCNKSSNCKYCQDFISKDLFMAYKFQEFVLQYHEYYYPDIDSFTLGEPQTSGTKYLIDIDSLNYLRKSMFCFLNMTYDKINVLLPKHILKKWDTIGQDYILKLYLNVGDWNPKYPSPQVRVGLPVWPPDRADDRRDYGKKITYVGGDSLTLHFKMVNDTLIYNGDKDEIASYKSCYQ